MTLIIELTPQVESKLRTAARLEGVSPSFLAGRIVSENLQSDSQEVATGLREPPALVRDNATLALLDEWRREGENATPEEIEEAEREWEEFRDAINETRMQAGSRILYP